jgi:hypothetical protein
MHLSIAISSGISDAELLSPAIFSVDLAVYSNNFSHNAPPQTFSRRLSLAAISTDEAMHP